MGHSAALFEGHISGSLFYLIELLQRHGTVQLLRYFGEASPVEHLWQPGTELLHGPANRVASGCFIHIVPLVLVAWIVMIVRPLIKAVKAQQLFALPLDLTCNLQGDPLVGHKGAVLQSKRDCSSLNFRSA